MEPANKELIRKWIDALRSGKYKQGKNELRTVKNEFCCLGVLCDISGMGYWELNDKDLPDPFYQYTVVVNNSKESERKFLPLLITKIIGIRFYGFIAPGKISLTEMNDSGKPFEEIADFIEKEMLNKKRII